MAKKKAMKKVAAKKAVAKKAVVKKAVRKTAVKKAAVKKTAAVKKPGPLGKILPTGGCETCTWGFDSSALDISKPLPRKVVATITKMQGVGPWPDGTPILTFTLSEK